MYPRKTKPAARMTAAVVAFGTLLAGCSDLYYARRDSIALGAGDAVAANAAEQTMDPWPPLSGNTNIAFNGQKMHSAVERYRTNKVIPPPDPSSLESTNQSGQTINQTTVNTGGGAPPSTSTQ